MTNLRATTLIVGLLFCHGCKGGVLRWEDLG